MERKELIQNFRRAHLALLEYVNSLPAEAFEYSFDNKWTAGQQLEHIFLSVYPLTRLFDAQFLHSSGLETSGRSSRAFETMEGIIRDRLSTKVKSPEPVVPSEVSAAKKDGLVAKMRQTLSEITTKMKELDEEELNKFLVPHPILGKLTLLELTYFSIVHAQHHMQACKRNLHTVNTGSLH